MDTNCNTEVTYHIKCRIDTIYRNKYEELLKQFHINDDPIPLNPTEMVKRITDGKYVIIKQSDGDDFDDYGMMYGLHWRDPAVPADKAGYDKAHEALNKERAKAKDAAILLSNEKAYDVLLEFEDWKYVN